MGVPLSSEELLQLVGACFQLAAEEAETREESSCQRGRVPHGLLEALLGDDSAGSSSSRAELTQCAREIPSSSLRREVASLQSFSSQVDAFVRDVESAIDQLDWSRGKEFKRRVEVLVAKAATPYEQADVADCSEILSTYNAPFPSPWMPAERVITKIEGDGPDFEERLSLVTQRVQEVGVDFLWPKFTRQLTPQRWLNALLDNAVWSSPDIVETNSSFVLSMAAMAAVEDHEARTKRGRRETTFQKQAEDVDFPEAAGIDWQRALLHCKRPREGAEGRASVELHSNVATAVCFTQGLHRKAMEDAHSVTEVMIGPHKATMRGIYDGHSGDKMARYTAEQLPRNFFLAANELHHLGTLDFDVVIANALRRAIVQTHYEFTEDTSGTTVLATVEVAGTLWTASVGDARAFIVYGDGTRVDLSRDRNVSRGLDIEEVFLRGGRVDLTTGRVVSGRRNLNLSASIGDHNLAGIDPLPEITAHPISGMGFLVVGCDGVFARASNAMHAEELLKCVRIFEQLELEGRDEVRGKLLEELLAVRLLGLTQYAGTSDNVSLIVARLNS